MIFWRESFIGKGSTVNVNIHNLSSRPQHASASLYLYTYFNDLRLLLNGVWLPVRTWPRFKMSFKAVPSRAIARSLRRTTIAPSCLQVSPWIQYRLESTNKSPAEQHGSFKGQLYESTAARLQREREERQRFSQERGEGSGGRNAALTFGAFSVI